MNDIVNQVSDGEHSLLQQSDVQVDTFSQRLADLFSEGIWMQRDNVALKDLSVCQGVATEDTKMRTCALCVALNRTVFHSRKRPTFTHPHCKCKQKPQGKPNVTLDFPTEKITRYLFVKEDKRRMMHSMGYTIEHAKLIYDLISAKVKESFLKVNYVLKQLDIYGQRMGIYIEIDGIDGCIGKKYKCHVGCVAYPNAMLKVVSPLMRDKEIK